MHRLPIGRMTRQILAGVLIAMSGGQVVGADQIVFGQYDAFTLYRVDQEPLKDDVLLVFHGFASAIPNGAYKKLNEALFTKYSVIGFNYDYFDLAANDEAMDKVWEQLLSDKDIVFAGTSLGGFWANYYAQRYGVDRVLLVNPVINPLQQLRQFIGVHYVEKRQMDLVVTQKDIDGYVGRKGQVDPAIDRLVLVTRDDEVLDYRLAKEEYAGSKDRLEIFDTGGHTLDLSEPRFADLISEFLDLTD